MKKTSIYSAVAALLLWQHPGAAMEQTQTYPILRSGDRTKLEELLQKGVAPDFRDHEGNTLLMQAAVYGQTDSLRMLLEKGADVNATNTAGATALMRAAGDFSKIQLLVEKGAKVNARSALGNTALILAARPFHSSEAVKYLLEHGADIHATNHFGVNAIITAAAGDDIETVRVLIKHGADVNSHSRGSQEVTLWGGGRSPLMWAAFHGNLPLMKLLLDSGAEVNSPEGFGTPLTAAAWADRYEAAALLIERGAQVDQKEFMTGYTALHWAASSETEDPRLVSLLLKHGANPNAEGGENVDAFLGTPQTPLMLALKRGDTPITKALVAAGAKGSAPKAKEGVRAHRELPTGVTLQLMKQAVERSIPVLQQTAKYSKNSFIQHGSRQDCVSCHQQYLPLLTMATARKSDCPVDRAIEDEVLAMVRKDQVNRGAMTWEATFHPEPAHSFGYALLSMDALDQPPSIHMDAVVHHLLIIQGRDGQWHNNLPRPPIQSSDISATALAIKALASYGFPGLQNEIQHRIERAQNWLWNEKPLNTEERAYQLLGLVWSGENKSRLEPLVAALLKEQHQDGGWAQLPHLSTDAYATGQALYALQAAALKTAAPEYQRGIAWLLQTQLDDGSWFVARRAFPFQPTMKSGFPHSRDSWISASGTSWATMAISLAIREPELHASSRN